MYCANCNFIFHSRPYWNTSYRLLELKRYPAPHEFKSSLSETLAELLLTWLACKSLWSSCTSHEELGGQAAPKSHEGETRKFIRNCFSNPRLLLMWGMHASVDLKCWWTSFLGNVYSILTPSLIAPKHLKETSKSHHIGWEKKSFFFFYCGQSLRIEELFHFPLENQGSMRNFRNGLSTLDHQENWFWCEIAIWTEDQYLACHIK